MHRSLVTFAFGFSLATSAVPTASAQPVDLELVLAVDASGSIDEDEMRLQRQGYASAFITDRIIKAVRSGYHGAIAVMYLEWAAVGCERILVNWTRLSDMASAQTFADAIISAPASIPCPGGNAIGDAIAFSAANMASNEWMGERRVIDVSGDGPNTLGRPATLARDAAVAHGIVINGLAIRATSWYGRNLTEHYRSNIIGGPGAFVMEAEKGETFADAVLNKLVREIAALEPAR
jgi:hypothetical protein